jgi:hypothetical protein
MAFYGAPRVGWQGGEHGIKESHGRSVLNPHLDRSHSGPCDRYQWFDSMLRAGPPHVSWRINQAFDCESLSRCSQWSIERMKHEVICGAWRRAEELL